jgi:hypothetical protein
MPNSGRKNSADLYRPVGPKPISLGINATPGGVFQLSQQVDLSLPIRGFRFSYKLRAVVGVAGFTTPTPEGFLNGISNLFVFGTNARQKGNVTLWNLDLASIYGIQGIISPRRASYYSINSGTGETQTTEPSMPWPADNNPVGTAGTYDVRINFDLPFHPFGSNVFGNHPHWVPAYLVRNEEWKDSVIIQGAFATQTGAGGIGFLGTSAGTTTITFSGYGGVGNPTLDVYSLPIVMGLDLKDNVLPGLLSRASSPINTILQSAGSGIPLLNMQKQPTTRVFVKTGTGTVPPAMATLNDTNVTAEGILLGANRNVRNVVDVFMHKQQQVDTYARNEAQGWLLFDFMDSGNPDSAYPGQDIGDGSTFQLTANVTGLANAQGIIVQEQTLHTPTGALYTF